MFVILDARFDNWVVIIIGGVKIFVFFDPIESNVESSVLDIGMETNLN